MLQRDTDLFVEIRAIKNINKKINVLPPKKKKKKVSSVKCRMLMGRDHRSKASGK